MEILNGCISFNIGRINTKLENVANFNGLFLTFSDLEFLNGCILFNIGLINNKLEIVANFNVFFLTIWVLCRLSHNKRTCTSPSWFETRQLSLSFTRLLAQLHVCMVSIKWPVTSLLLEGLVTLV